MTYRVPLMTLLARETFEVVDVVLGTHHHFERGNHFTARRAVSRRPKQPINNEKTLLLNYSIQVIVGWKWYKLLLSNPHPYEVLL